MKLHVYPRGDVDRVRVRRAPEGVTWLFTPLLRPIEPTHQREAMDLLDQAEAAELFAAYGIESAEELYAVAKCLPCRVCTVPLDLRPPELPWPCCPVHMQASGTG